VLTLNWFTDFADDAISPSTGTPVAYLGNTATPTETTKLSIADGGLHGLLTAHQQKMIQALELFKEDMVRGSVEKMCFFKWPQLHL
jgi:hypothetical protein